MLLQFNFKNYRSFRDDNTLDMTAAKIQEFSDKVVNIGNDRVLPVAAIFGANASGKSNVFEAFRFMAKYVIKSFSFGGDVGREDEKNAILKTTPFLFNSQSKDDVSSFEVYFIDKSERTYNYGFTINKFGVVEEWLNSSAKTSRGEQKRIFYRNEADGEKELDLSGLTKKISENIIVSLERETLVVSLGAKLKSEKLKFIRDWFCDMNFVNYGIPAENFFISRLIPKNFDTDENIRKSVVRYISSFDDSIIDFKVEKIDDDNDKKRFKIESVHKMADTDKTVTIPLGEESAGTLKMFSLYSMLHEVLRTGNVLFIDELNARLHPLLVRNFVITFLNPKINVNHAQLIFTSHDAWQLNGNMLRRDEIWFTEKDNEGASTLYSLADFVDEDGSKIRKDENYEKNYLLGKYGAIPALTSLDMFKSKDEENSDGKN